MPPSARPSSPLGPAAKARLTWLICLTYLQVLIGLRRHSLPDLARRLAALPELPPRNGSLDPVRVGRIVYRVLRIGPYRPRCLVSSLVAFRLLRRQGVEAELVIGLPNLARTKDAHSWIEVGGVDVGPPPGRGDQVELVRYPPSDDRGAPASAT